MDENLQRLAQALRAERCPPQVVAGVKRRIAERQRPVPTFRLTSAALSVGLAILAVGWVVWTWPSRQLPPTSSHDLRYAEQIQVAQQAGAALGYIGSILSRIGDQGKNALLQEAVPPLRSGFEAASETIKRKL